jgi:hypothetical protein
MSERSQLNNIELLELVANFYQILGYLETKKVASNTEIMNELDKQNVLYFDTVLDTLDAISQKQDLILEKLSNFPIKEEELAFEEEEGEE